jgi:hypothetical protein
MGVSLKFHWRLSFNVFRPRPLLLRPLSTTFVHILRLNSLLSIGKFQVETKIIGQSGKALQIAVNR